jgi:hypothetical protein
MPSSDEPCTSLEENRPRDSNGASHVTPDLPTPLPTSQIMILWFFHLCEAIAYSVIYPFVNEVSTTHVYVPYCIDFALSSSQLVKGLDVTGGDDRRVGYYVGLIVRFPIVCFPSSPFLLLYLTGILIFPR